MQRALDFLAGLSLGLFVVSGWTAYTRTPELHALVGLSTGIVLLLMHTLVFIFFIGTGRAVKEAVAGRGLATSFLAEDKRFMAQVIAPGSFGPLTIVVASFLGAAQSEVVRFWIHPGLIALAMVVNAWAFLRQRRVIAAKRRHLEEARQALREIDGAPVPATEVGSGPPAQFAIGAIVLLSGLSAAGYYLYRRFIMGDLRAPSAASLIAGVALAVLGAVLMQRGRASS